MGNASYFFHGDSARAFVDHFGERPSGNKCIDQFAIQSVGEFSQLPERDPVSRFGLLGFMKRRAGYAQPLRLLPFCTTQGFPNEL